MKRRQQVAKPADGQRPLPIQFETGDFSDTEWRLYRPARGMMHSLDWSNVILANDSRLTDMRYRGLLEAAKTYIVLLANGTNATRKPRAGTILEHFVSLNALLLWMSTRNILSFADFTLPHVGWVPSWRH